MVDQHIHSKHNVYFLAQDSLHNVTVPPRTNDDSQHRVVTLFVKDNYTGTTRFITEDASSMPIRTKIEPITSKEEKDRILSLVEQLISNSVAF